MNFRVLFRPVSTVLFLTCWITLSLTAATQAGQNQKQLEKLNAFAKTYGYVRFFHPSDPASLIDWDAFALYGVQRVFDSEDEETTERMLQNLFGPLVVDLEIYQGPEKPKPETQKVNFNEVVAWQHLGVGLGNANSLYASARTNRPNKVAMQADPFGNVLQSLDPADFREKEIRMRFRAKVDEGKCGLQGWMRVDRESGQKGLFDNMGDRPIRKREWDQYEISGIVDEDADKITFGVMFMGAGSALIDDVVLQVKDKDDWKDLEIKNGDFEQGKRRPEQWSTRGKGYTFKTESGDVAEGDRALRIARKSRNRGDLFETVPKSGEVVDAQIADNLRIRMPLTLTKEESYITGESEVTDALMAEISSFDIRDPEQKVLCAANVVIAWNIFQHFYPYFEQVETDWQQVLQNSLSRALKSSSRQETTQTLKWLVAQLHDGHGNVFDTLETKNRRLLPVTFDWIENQLVVVASDDERVSVGDVITHIDSKESESYLKDREFLISGSPQWKRYRSTSNLAIGNLDETIELKIRRQDDDDSVTVAFDKEKPATTEKREVIDFLIKGEEAQDNIYYVDLGRAKPAEVNPMIKDFAEAKGIVFDLRGYPRGTQFLLQHMTDQHMMSQKWQPPKQIRPDRVDMKEIETISRWQMPAKQPRFKGKMVFLTNANAISYAESVMSIVANYKLGEIIGSPTAGANGNVNPFALPGKFRVSWTGMRVMNHDDSQHHVRGVQPTIPLRPTIKAIREGRDEYIEKAVEVINQN